MVTLRSFAVVVLVVNVVFWRASLLQSQGPPSYKMQVLSPHDGLRVQTDSAGGQVGSFGGFGEFDVDAPGIIGGRFAVKESGNVGIGTPNPTQRLSVAGTIESTSGGFRFPDGTVQSHAGDVYTTFQDNVPLNASPGSSILHLAVPVGTYFVEARLSLFNSSSDPFKNNNRDVFCVNVSASFADRSDHDIPGSAHAAMALHSILTATSSGFDLQCGVATTDAVNVTAQQARFTAVRIGGAVH